MFIYFDTCCLNRPYDDQSQPRIQLEAAAVLAILERVTAGDVQLASSSVLQFEIHRRPDPAQRHPPLPQLLIIIPASHDRDRATRHLAEQAWIQTSRLTPSRSSRSIEAGCPANHR